MPAVDLAELAAEALNAAADLLGSDAPSRQVMVVGTPAFDACDQLAVGVGPVRIADVERSSPDIPGGTMCMTMTLVELALTLSACVPTVDEAGNPPSADKLNLSSNRLYALAWTMWCGLRNRQRAGSLFPGDPERVVSVGPLRPVETLGGRAGWTVDLTVQLDPDPDLGA